MTQGTSTSEFKLILATLVAMVVIVLYAVNQGYTPEQASQLVQLLPIPAGVYAAGRSVVKLTNKEKPE